MATAKILSILCLILFIVLMANWQTDDIYIWTAGGILAVIAQTLNYIGGHISGDEFYRNIARAPIVIVGILILAFIAVNTHIYILIVAVTLFWIMVIAGWIMDYMIWRKLH